MSLTLIGSHPIGNSCTHNEVFVVSAAKKTGKKSWFLSSSKFLLKKFFLQNEHQKSRELYGKFPTSFAYLFILTRCIDDTQEMDNVGDFSSQLLMLHSKADTLLLFS